MPDRTYTFVYKLDNRSYLKGMAEIDAANLKSQGIAKQTAAILKAVGSNPAGLKMFAAEARKMAVELKGMQGAASQATAGLKSVGTGNSAMSGLNGRAVSLTAQLNAIAAAAAAATGALAGVGAGVNLPTAGGAGGGGASGGKGAAGGLGVIGRATAGLGKHLAYAAFHRGISAVGQAGKDGKQFYEDAANLTTDYRKDLQELAVLQGKTAADDKLIRSDLDFQKNTLLNPEDSRTFRLEFGGAISPALKARGKDGTPNITPETAKDLEVEAAKFTARYGLDATTGGRMAGLLGVTTKVPSAAAGIGIMEQSMGQLNVEGVGPVKGMASHLLALSGNMLEEGGGRFKDYPGMAARLAVSTVNEAGNAAKAARRIVQSDKLLRKFNGKEEEEFLKKVGITTDDDYETAIRKIAPHIAGKDGELTLHQAGFGNDTEIKAVVAEAKVNGIVDQQLANMPSVDKARNDAIAKNKEYATTDAGLQQGAENRLFASTVEVGMLGETLKTGTTMARARMADPNQPGGSRLKAKGMEVIRDMGRGLQGYMEGYSGEDQRVHSDMIQNLMKGGESVGVDVAAKFPNLAANMQGWVQSPEDLARDYGAAKDAVSAAGGDPFGGAASDAAKKLRAAADALDKVKQGNPGGKQGGGPAPPPGNGGGGVNPGRR